MSGETSGARSASGEMPSVLAASELARRVSEGLDAFPVFGRRVLVVVPDHTRSGPTAALYRLVSAGLAARQARSVTWLVALGTHRPLAPSELEAHLGVDLDAEGRTPLGEPVLNHAWDDARALVDFGEVSAESMAELSGGLLRQAVPVRANAELARHDLALVVGPVFPHEVVGFSGGNKYFFPGLSGPEMIDVSHWLGALITTRAIIGRPGTTPVRAMIDAAAGLLPIERCCLATVVAPEARPAGEAGVVGLFAGSCEEAWRQAAELSARVHVRRVPRPFRRVVSVMPPRYEDLWTAAKGMYKLEPVVADGGEVLLYAPHLRAVSTVHGDDLARVGYHCRDYFLAQWERFADVPGRVLAHSTHLRGTGTYDPVTGVESCRIGVRLASAIDAGTCAAMNLGYADPAAVDLEALAREPDTLVVPNAGEVLYRLEEEPLEPWQEPSALATAAPAASGRAAPAASRRAAAGGE